MSAANQPGGAPSSGGSMMPIIIGVVVICLLAIGYYMYSKNQTAAAAAAAADATPPPPPPPPPVIASTPATAASSLVNPTVLSTLYSTGQKIQDTELEIGLASVPFASAPFGYSLTAPAAYSMMMDVYIAQTGDSWRNIMEHSPAAGADLPVGATYRRPAVFITGNDNKPANRIMVTHADSSNNAIAVTTVNVAPIGKYFNLAWVIANNQLTVYWNGVADPAGAISASFSWPPTDQPWTWLQSNYLNNMSGSVKVKNVYYFNRAISSSDFGNIASVYGGSGSTSHYSVEPYEP